MKEKSQGRLLVLIQATIVALLIANLGLFYRVILLQDRVFQALKTLRVGDAASTFQALRPGTPVPEPELSSATGELFSLARFTGQPYLLVFSSTECPACEDIYPVLNDFQLRHPEVPVVMVSRGTEEENRALTKRVGLTVPVFNWHQDLTGAFKVPGTPFIYAVDAQGMIAASGFANSLQKLESFIGEAGG